MPARLSLTFAAWCNDAADLHACRVRMAHFLRAVVGAGRIYPGGVTVTTLTEWLNESIADSGITVQDGLNLLDRNNLTAVVWSTACDSMRIHGDLRAKLQDKLDWLTSTRGMSVVRVDLTVDELREILK